MVLKSLFSRWGLLGKVSRRCHFDNRGCTCNLRILGTEKMSASCLTYTGLIQSWFFLHNQVELSSEFVQGKWCEINSREAFLVFGILCTSAGAQNSAEGLGHTGNDVTYTRSHNGRLIWFEWMTQFWQYIHAKYHNVVFSIKKHRKIK